MKLIVGLGNPGKKYEGTRHNTGFFVVDKLCEQLKVSLDKTKCKAIYGIYRLNDEKIIIAKPQTYMNLSGESVKSLMKFYDVDVIDVIIIHDDLDLPVGKIRLRHSGSSGGQKGMGNIIDLLGTRDINRIRVGISNDKSDVIDYVLGKFSKEEFPLYEESVIKAKDALVYSLDHDFEIVMSKFN